MLSDIVSREHSYMVRLLVILDDILHNLNQKNPLTIKW